jgi:hypothetical protein
MMKKVIINFVLVTVTAIHFPLWASNPTIDIVRDEVIKMRTTGTSINAEQHFDVKGGFLISQDHKYISEKVPDLSRISAVTSGELVWNILDGGEKYFHFYIPGINVEMPKAIDVFYNSQGYQVYQ